MKKILITGENSYIGSGFKTWLEKYKDQYRVDTISVRSDEWKEMEFSVYDVIYHVAGIAHIKETKENANLYFKVNRDLTFDVAKKAKRDGVKQFVFLSSMSVYGLEYGVINKMTALKPQSNYGKSKLNAEELIQSLSAENFKVTVLRPPMIYGKGCKGNYQRLAKIARVSPFFPDINNNRSMIYIDNLSEFVRLLIDDSKEGIFFPQNGEYVCTSKLVNLISIANGKKIYMTKLFNPFFRIKNLSILNKVFGSLIYELNLSAYDGYKPIPFEETIRLTENA